MALPRLASMLPRLLPAILLLTALPAGAEDLPPWTPDANALRSEVPDAYKWDLDQLFKSDDACRDQIGKLGKKLEDLSAYEGELDEPKQLANCLSLYFDLHDQVNHCTLYSNLRVETDQADDAAQALSSEALALMDDLMQRAAFIRTGILAMDDATMAKAYDEQPELAKNESYIEGIRRRRDRVFSPETERVLGILGDNLWAEIDLNEIPSSNESTFGALLTDIPWPMVHDEDGNEVQMTLSNYGQFRGSPDREVRKEAVTKFFATLRQYEHAFAATFGGQYEFTVALARSRGYETAIDAYLGKDNLDPKVYTTLIEAVNDNLEYLHRYISLRKKAMGLDEVHLYDLYRPLTEGVERDIEFKEAHDQLMVALQPLGKEYLDILEVGMNPANGWIDLYPNKNKRSGAFSASVYGRHPYVLMNYQDSLDDMSTLAHEYGHAAHSQLAMTHQPYSSYRYVPFLAEIASTVNEALLNDYMVANAASDAERAYLLSDRLESLRTTIYRQTLFAEFELAVHRFVEEGTPVTATLLADTYAELVTRYYGPDYTIDPDDGMEWAYIPHFYYKYYVFTYATGLSSGVAIADNLRGPKAEETQKGLVAMLSGGSSEPPLALLKKAGVDLTKPDAIEAALKSFGETLTELEGILEAPAPGR